MYQVSKNFQIRIFTRPVSNTCPTFFYQGARPDGDLAVPPELEAYFSVDAQVHTVGVKPGTAIVYTQFSGTGIANTLI